MVFICDNLAMSLATRLTASVVALAMAMWSGFVIAELRHTPNSPPPEVEAIELTQTDPPSNDEELVEELDFSFELPAVVPQVARNAVEGAGLPSAALDVVEKEPAPKRPSVTRTPRVDPPKSKPPKSKSPNSKPPKPPKRPKLVPAIPQRHR